jgi:hypothetical protein
VPPDVVGGAGGAAGVSGERVLVGGPGAVGDLALDARFDDHRELGCGALDALAELARRPVLWSCEDGGGEHERAHVAEERAQLLVDYQRVPRRSGCRGKKDRLCHEQVVVEDVDERFEEAADAGLVDRGDGDERVGCGDTLDGGLQLLAWKPGDRRARDIDREWRELCDRRRRLRPRLTQELEGLSGDPVGEQPARGGVRLRRHSRRRGESRAAKSRS